MDNALQSLALVAAAVGIAASVYQLIRSSWEQRVAIGNSFRSVVDGLTSTDQVQRLGSAILLRRFFNTDSEFARRRLLRRKKGLPYADDAIGIIAATLRAEPTGHVQKTLGDGLAFAPDQDLRKRDFQSTNLRNSYLSLLGAAGHAVEDPDARLDVSEADFFMAELEGASFRRSRCHKTVFFQANARSTVFRDADLTESNFEAARLRGANFRDASASRASFVRADLRSADFRRADVSSADFTGSDLTGAALGGAYLSGACFLHAQGLPAEVEQALDEDGVYRLVQRIESDEGPHGFDGGAKKFFVSAPNDGSSPLPELVASVLQDDDDRPFEVVRIPRSEYHDDRHLTEIRELMEQCVGAIVVGIPQLRVGAGTWRPDTAEEVVVFDEALATPWNDIEAGVAVGLDLPILAIRAGTRAQGIFGLVEQSGGFKPLEFGPSASHGDLAKAIREWAEEVAG